MTSYFATQDSEDGVIAVNADIFAFATREDAETYLRSGFDPQEWNVDIEVGRFSDCWIKMHSDPTKTVIETAPFSFGELIIKAPGQHPGGQQWWIEPSAEILVATAMPIEA